MIKSDKSHKLESEAWLEISKTRCNHEARVVIKGDGPGAVLLQIVFMRWKTCKSSFITTKVLVACEIILDCSSGAIY